MFMFYFFHLENKVNKISFLLAKVSFLSKTFCTGEMFTFGYSQTPPYITYRVISKEGVMQEPVPITIPKSVMMHDFAITENYAIFMDLPLYFMPKVRLLDNVIPVRTLT